MKKIPGKIEERVVKEEIGAKWEASDGKIFDSENDCKAYEQKLEEEARKSEVERTYDAFIKKFDESPLIYLNDASDEIPYRLMKFETKEEFVKYAKVLVNTTRVNISLNGSFGWSCFLEKLEVLGQPLVLLCHYDYDDSGDWDYTSYDFVEVNLYKNRMLQNITDLDEKLETL